MGWKKRGVVEGGGNIANWRCQTMIEHEQKVFGTMSIVYHLSSDMTTLCGTLRNSLLWLEFLKAFAKELTQATVQ